MSFWFREELHGLDETSPLVRLSDQLNSPVRSEAHSAPSYEIKPVVVFQRHNTKKTFDLSKMHLQQHQNDNVNDIYARLAVFPLGFYTYL